MESILQLYQLAMVALPVYAFVSLRKLIRYGGLAKTRASLRYAAIVFAPMLLYTAIYFVAIGVEELLGISLVAGEFARSFPLAIVLGLVVWLFSVLVFVVAACFVNRAASASIPKQ